MPSLTTPSTRNLQANGATFSTLEWDGGLRGLVLASHGFPDHAPTYRYLGPALAAAGYRVVAPYLRGYAPTVSTSGPYHPMAIAHDLAEIATKLRREDEPLFMVGHDWGAAATYFAAKALGDAVRRIATLAVPHGPGFTQALISNAEQQRRSWYMFFFQLPFAEAAVANNDFAFIERLWRDWSPDYRLPPEEMAELKTMFATGDVLQAAIAYYRDTFQSPQISDALIEFSHKATGKIDTPCLYLHGDNDGCVGYEIADAMDQSFSGELVKELLPGVGHFLHLEAPDVVNARILAWFEQASQDAVGGADQ